MRAAVAVFAVFLLSSGCTGNCRKTTPYVPFLEDASAIAPRDGDVAATDTGVDAGSQAKFQKIQSALAPAGATSWSLDGLAFEAPSGSALVAAIARDLDGDAQRDVVAWTQPPGGGGGELRFYRGDGKGGLLAGRSVTTGSEVTLPAPCVAKPSPTMLMLVGPHSVALDLRPTCGEGAPTPRRFVIAAFAPTPSIRWSARVAEPPFGWNFVIDVDEAKDDDGDGVDDPKLILALEGGGPPWESGDRVSAELRYLDRPAGLSRDRKFPETSFQGHAWRALSMVNSKKPDAVAKAMSTIRRLRILHAAICAEGGAPWLEIGSERGVPCAASKALEDAGLAEIKAAIAGNDVLTAAAVRERLASAAVAKTKSTRNDIDKLLNSVESVWGTMREAKVVPSTPSKGAPAWGALAFDGSGKVLVRTATDVVRIDPATFAETVVDEPSWAWEVKLPEKDARLTAVIDPCDAPNLAARVAGHDVPTGASLLPLAMLPMMAPNRCSGGAAAHPAVPVAWSDAGLYTLVAGEPVMIPGAVGRAGSPLPLGAKIAGAFVQGAPRSPNGQWLVAPTRFGLVRRDDAAGKSTLVHVKELEGLYPQLRECAIGDAGARIACVRENRVVLIDTSAAAAPPAPPPE